VVKPLSSLEFKSVISHSHDSGGDSSLVVLTTANNQSSLLSLPLCSLPHTILLPSLFLSIFLSLFRHSII
jgi:hypothetical protein